MFARSTRRKPGKHVLLNVQKGIFVSCRYMFCHNLGKRPHIQYYCEPWRFPFKIMCEQSTKISFQAAVKFITIYDTKKLSYFVANKDKLPPLSRSNIVYEVACPGCGKTYIGMTQKCLSVRLKEHATRLSSSAVGEHFSVCEHAQYLASLQNQFTLLKDLPLPSENLSPIEILVLNNYKILHSTKSNNYNILAFLDALLFKHNKPFLMQHCS